MLQTRTAWIIEDHLKTYSTVINYPVRVVFLSKSFHNQDIISKFQICCS